MNFPLNFQCSCSIYAFHALISCLQLLVFISSFAINFCIFVCYFYYRVLPSHTLKNLSNKKTVLSLTSHSHTIQTYVRTKTKAKTKLTELLTHRTKHHRTEATSASHHHGPLDARESGGSDSSFATTNRYERLSLDFFLISLICFVILVVVLGFYRFSRLY